MQPQWNLNSNPNGSQMRSGPSHSVSSHFTPCSSQVVAGLRKFIPAADLSDRLVCVVCNLKPAKLAGQPSEAMILAGSCVNEGGEEIVKVRR